MLRNPIIHREVLSSLRTRKALVMQTLFLVAAAGLIWLLWPAGGLQDVGGEQARRILSILAIGQLVMVVLFAPAFTAASISGEKEHNTFEGLFASLMRPWEIAIGKIVGALAFLIIIIFTGLPALSCVFLLGGVSGTEVLGVIGLLLLTAVYLGMIGLAISTLLKRSYRAIIITYAVLLAVVFLVALPAWPISRHLLSRGGPLWQNIFHILASFSPLQAMFSLVWPKSLYAQGAAGMPAFWVCFIPISVGMTILLGIFCLYRLRRPVAPPRPREAHRVIERNEVTAKTVVWHLWFFDPRRRRKPLAFWQNPVLSKEFRTRPMLQTRWLMRSVSICLMVSFLLMFLVIGGVSVFVSETSQIYPLMLTAVAAMLVVLIAMVGPAISSSAICGDRETGVWDLLRVTPIPSWRLVSGKFQAAMLPLVLLTLATMPAMFLLLYFDDTLLTNMIRVCYVIGMTILFVTTAGAFFSSLAPKTSIATACTYALVITLVLASLLVLLADELFSQRLMALILLTNPVAAAMEAAGHPTMQKLNILNTHLKIMGGATAVLFFLTVLRVFQLRRAS